MDISSPFLSAVLTCTEERAAGVVAAFGLIRYLSRSTVKMQVSGNPA